MSPTPRRALALVAAIVVALAVGLSCERLVGWTAMVEALPGGEMLTARYERVRGIVRVARRAVPLLRPGYPEQTEDTEADFDGPLRER